MKKVLVLMIALALVFTLAACKKEDKTLQMLWWSDGTEGDVMQTLLDEYKEETGVTIELNPIAYNDYEAKLATMISGGEAPALARVTEGHQTNFEESILSLEGVFDEAGFTNLAFNSDGDVMSLPMDITANGMFVNTDLLDANDVDYPALGDTVWTWDQFETEMMKLDGQSGVAAPGIFDHQAHRFMALMYQNGVTIWDTPYSSSNLKSAAAVEVIDMLIGFYEDGFLPRDTYVTKNSASLFRTGQYGFHLSGNWNVSNYQDLDFNWAVVPMPQNSNRATILGGKSLSAFDGSGMEKEAKAFIAWMAEGEQHDQYTGGVPYLTPRLGATVDYGVFDDQYAVFLDEIGNTDAKYVADWKLETSIPGMYPIINQFVEDAASGEYTAIALLTQLEIDLKAAAE